MKHEEIRPVKTYYNEIEPFAVEWLKGLIANGQLPDGDIDTRSIADVQPSDLDGYADCHFFAGIGGWALALRRVGVEGQGIWTGSCPCQPFSSAGKQKGFSDERHLWPEFHRLIAECRPAAVFGEQVASPLGRTWLATVRSEMEDLGYGVGAADLCAAGVGAPHIRQRLWWVAHDGLGDSPRDDQRRERLSGTRSGREGTIGGPSTGRGAAHAQGERRSGVPGTVRNEEVEERQVGGPVIDSDGADGGLGDTSVPRLGGHPRDGDRGGEPGRHEAESGGPVAPAGGNGRVAHADDGQQGLEQGSSGGIRERTSGHSWPRPRRGGGNDPWAGAEYIECLDGKARPVESGIFPLAHGVPNRVGTLRGSGNAIVPQLAEVFVRAALDVEFMA